MDGIDGKAKVGKIDVTQTMKNNYVEPATARGNHMTEAERLQYERGKTQSYFWYFVWQLSDWLPFLGSWERF